MNGSMITDTPSSRSVTTSIVCLNYIVTIFWSDFRMDLVCLPLSQLEIILGMNRLEFNHLFINYFDKLV